MCQHRQAEDETCSHAIRYRPVVQDMGIKRQTQLCEQLVDEPRTRKLLKDEQSDLYKLDLVFVKGDEALGWTSQSKPTSPAGKAAQKLQKYQHLEGQVQELTNATIIRFMGFPLGGIRAIMSC